MGDFRKNILQTDFVGEKLSRIYLRKIISCTEKISLMTYIMLKKILHRCMLGKKFPEVWEKKFLPKLTHPYPLPHNIVDVIRQQNGQRAFIMRWLFRLKFCISSLKIRRQRTQVERENSKECSDSFLWTNESFSLLNCLSRNSTLLFSRRIRVLGLFEPTEAARFSKKLEVHSVQ